jgi:hypothetical protein
MDANQEVFPQKIKPIPAIPNPIPGLTWKNL